MLRHLQNNKAWVLGMFCLLGVLAVAARSGWAEFRVGAGMEYFSTKVVALDNQNRFFSTLLQTTLAAAEADWETPEFSLELGGGISDWNASGQWDGSGFSTLTGEPFGWVGQWQWNLAGQYQLLPNLGLGARWQDHALRLYDGITQHQYVVVRMQTVEGFLDYTALKAKDITLDLIVAYAPFARIDYSQDFGAYIYDQDTTVIFSNSAAGMGQCWLGRIKLHYLDSMGWGVQIGYEISRASFSALEQLKSVTLNSGELQGVFILRF